MSCSGALTECSKEAEEGRLLCPPFRREQGPASMHGCVRDLMSSAQCCRLSCDHFLLFLYTVICFLAFSLFVPSLSLLCFSPSLSLKEASVLFFSLLSLEPLPALSHLSSLPFYEYFSPSSDSLRTCLPSLSLPPTALHILPVGFSDFPRLLCVGQGGACNTCLCLSRPHFSQHFVRLRRAEGESVT